MLISHWYEDICDNSIPSHKQHQWNWTHYYTSRGLICYLLRTEWYSKTDHLGVSTAHNNGHKTLTRRGTKPQCLKIPKLFKSMLGLPNIWASKWEIGFMQMSTAKKTNECNHQCLWWDHHVCSLCSRGWVKLSCWKYVSALNASPWGARPYQNHDWMPFHRDLAQKCSGGSSGFEMDHKLFFRHSAARFLPIARGQHRPNWEIDAVCNPAADLYGSAEGEQCLRLKIKMPHPGLNQVFS